MVAPARPSCRPPGAGAVGLPAGQPAGRLDLHARNGQLLELEPGAGRVLGLLSVTQLPRRLMFDFRDFFSKGFAFNQIDGSMQFGQGMARTDKVLIEGPAANITIRGQADLRNQQFDQTIDVNPRAGNLLTVVGQWPVARWERRWARPPMRYCPSRWARLAPVPTR